MTDDNKDSRIFVEHILASINLVERYVKNKRKRNFLNSVDLQDKVIRRIEIIGEAIRHISAKIKGQYPDVHWKDIAGMRDKLIHVYFGVDLELTWEVVQKDLPVLKQQMLEIKEGLS